MSAEKNIFIMGDSYSTYKGSIPDGYHSYYGDDRTEDPIVHGVDKTWWKILQKDKKLNILVNDSFSGSTICTTVRDSLSVETSFVKRMDKYISEDYFKKNEIDTIIIFGGTNDSWIDAPIGELMYDRWNDSDLKSILPAFCYLLHNTIMAKGNREIIVVINNDLKEVITNGFVEACQKYNVRYVQLREIDKQNGHPTEKGMKEIAKQIENLWTEIEPL